MKRVLSFVCVLAVLLESRGFITNRNKLQLLAQRKPSQSNPVVEGRFRQKLDHLNQDDTRYWNQRFWSNHEFVKSYDSPIFLFINGESTADSAQMQSGTWYTWARKHHAMLYQLEHRFYGDSHPTSNTSVENLKYLTSRQAVEDIAYFIKETNKILGYSDKNKWILFGGGYAGALSAWSRLHHPELVTGAVSSSSMVLAKANYPDFYNVVRDSLNFYVPGCADVVTEAIEKVHELVSDEATADKVFKPFYYCGEGFDFKNPQEYVNFYETIVSNIYTTVQNNDISSFKAVDICNRYMMNETWGDPMARLAALYSRERKAGDESCSGTHYKDLITDYKGEQWTDSTSIQSDRQWMFQLCNELGYEMTSETEDSLFKDYFPFQYYIQQCIDIFGESFNKQHLLQAVDEVNERNQGLDIKVTNVVFLQGSIDPWHTLGMINHPTNESPLIFINGSSHNADMDDVRAKSPELTAARNKVNKYLRNWIKK